MSTMTKYEYDIQKLKENLSNLQKDLNDLTLIVKQLQKVNEDGLNFIYGKNN